VCIRLCSFIVVFICSIDIITFARANANGQQSAHWLFDAYHDFRIQINPIEATKAGDREHNDRLVNYITEEHRLFLLESYAVFLDAIAQIPADQLSDADHMSLAVMQWDAEVKKQGLENALVSIASPVYDLPHFALMPVTQMSAYHLEVSLLASGQGAQPFETVADYEAWLLRAGQFFEWMRSARRNMEAGIEAGVVLPKSLIRRLHEQLAAYVEPPLEEHLFYQPVRSFPAAVSAAEQKRLRTAYATMVTDQLVPLFRDFREFLITDYLAAGTETAGLGALPHGLETYQYLIRYHTSTDMTAEEIHQLGLGEVQRIAAEMDRVREQVGYDGDLPGFLEHLRNKPELLPHTTPEQVLAHFHAIHARVTPHVGKLFDVTPKAGFEIRRTEAFREQTASAEYKPGFKDGSKPGVFYVPIPDAASYNIISDEALFLHEAIPGHHFQLSLQQENTDLPEFLHAEGMGVFVEGWALYAESLGMELGLYEDPYQYLGMLSMEMHRAIRLVVDTGIHAKGWTREQAIAFALAHEPESEQSVTAYIERYMAVPGQALSYKIGQLKIRELRTRAEVALGEAFSIRDFHQQVLGSGSLPLVLLEQKIDGWIAAQRAAKFSED